MPTLFVLRSNLCFNHVCNMTRLKRKFGIISAAGLLLFGLLTIRTPPTETLQPSPAAAIPHKIWQTWRRPVDNLGDDELQRFIQSWTTLNPDYRYELITDQAAVQFVGDHFQGRPDIVETFHRISDRILRADYLRYLLISSEGGIYSDVDTECTRPVYTWIPQKYQDTARCVIGIEYDARGNLLTEPFPDEISFCQWTFLAMPRHPVIQHVVDLVTKKLQQYGEGATEIVAKIGTDVGELTGPTVSAVRLEVTTCKFTQRLDLHPGYIRRTFSNSWPRS